MIPKENWIAVPDKHEPIISKEVFDMVQQLIGKNNVKTKGRCTYQHLLSGLLYCGECGEKMYFNRNKNSDEFHAVCYAYTKKQCTSASRNYVYEKFAEDFVFAEMKKLFKNKVSRKELVNDAQEQKISVELDGIIKQIQLCEKEFGSIQNAIRSLYKDKLKGVVSEQDYIFLTEDFQKERKGLENKLDTLSAKKAELEKYKDDSKEILLAIDDFLETEILTKTSLTKLISRIEVFRDNSIKIYVNFRCE